jgi:hypothetical protein
MTDPDRPNLGDALRDLLMVIYQETGIVWLTDKLNNLLLRLGRWWKNRTE